MRWKSRSRFEAFLARVGWKMPVRNHRARRAGAFEHVGQPVDDRFQIADQDRLAVVQPVAAFSARIGKVWNARGS
jgi:hypothetical protein